MKDYNFQKYLAKPHNFQKYLAKPHNFQKYLAKPHNIYTFRVIIESDEPEGYYGFVPILRGVHTCGNTIDEVKKNIREAIICHIQGLLKSKQSIPKQEDAIELIQSFSQKELSSVS